MHPRNNNINIVQTVTTAYNNATMISILQCFYNNIIPLQHFEQCTVPHSLSLPKKKYTEFSGFDFKENQFILFYCQHICDYISINTLTINILIILTNKSLGIYE